MYHREVSLATKASASMVPNNLSVTFNANTNRADFLYLHKSVAHLLLSGTEPGNFTHRNVVCKIPTASQELSFVMILEAKWVQMHDSKILVLATQKGIKIYDQVGSALLYWYGFSANGETVVFTRGIASIGGDTLCVGTSSGQILVFNVPHSGNGITFEEYLAGHQHSITAIASLKDKLVSADEQGCINIWNYSNGSSCQRLHQISGSGSPCLCLDVWENIIAAGYGTGEILFHDLHKGTLLGSITAHSRGVASIHIAQDTGTCVSVSTDSFVRVWELKAGTLEVSHLYSEQIVDHQLVGVQFTDSKGSSFGVTAYDTAEIFKFSRM